LTWFEPRQGPASGRRLLENQIKSSCQCCRASATRLTGKRWAAPYASSLLPSSRARARGFCPGSHRQRARVPFVGLGFFVMRVLYRGFPAPVLNFFFALRSATVCQLLTADAYLLLDLTAPEAVAGCADVAFTMFKQVQIYAVTQPDLSIFTTQLPIKLAACRSKPLFTRPLPGTIMADGRVGHAHVPG